MKSELIIIGFVVLIFAVLLFSGCTVKFKAQELEFDAQQTRVFELDGLDFLGVPIVKSTGPEKPHYDSGLPKIYAFK